ncbi:hypothetical protein [Pseudomonas sp. EYE_354]|uniref:hypothetical protein n=1 Tax=Pseudomonas sp. EYE_354 TaxID=2853449 RepID=UPI002003382A|nr:hypothetical protein [Pseudomonas sp. EYE_354]MCK6190721.1 hypothetical protein [Pseudomonas sp. EYE_354]
MSDKEIIFIESSNNPSPNLQKFAILSRSILNKNHKNCRVIGQSATDLTRCKGPKNLSNTPENKALGHHAKARTA